MPPTSAAIVNPVANTWMQSTSVRTRSAGPGSARTWTGGSIRSACQSGSPARGRAGRPGRLGDVGRGERNPPARTGNGGAGVVRYAGSQRVFQAVAAGRNSGWEPRRKGSDNHSIYNAKSSASGNQPGHAGCVTPARPACRQPTCRPVVHSGRLFRFQGAERWLIAFPPMGQAWDRSIICSGTLTGVGSEMARGAATARFRVSAGDARCLVPLRGCA
jgi:hypothetical protein